MVQITQPQHFKGWADLTVRHIDTFPKLTYPLMLLLAEDLHFRSVTVPRESLPCPKHVKYVGMQVPFFFFSVRKSPALGSGVARGMQVPAVKAGLSH